MSDNILFLLACFLSHAVLFCVQCKIRLRLDAKLVARTASTIPVPFFKGLMNASGRHSHAELEYFRSTRTQCSKTSPVALLRHRRSCLSILSYSVRVSSQVSVSGAAVGELQSHKAADHVKELENQARHKFRMCLLAVVSSRKQTPPTLLHMHSYSRWCGPEN